VGVPPQTMDRSSSNCIGTPRLKGAYAGWSAQAVPSRAIALRTVRRRRAMAVRASFLGFPASRSRRSWAPGADCTDTPVRRPGTARCGRRRAPPYPASALTRSAFGGPRG
jgi:hypothetical protein